MSSPHPKIAFIGFGEAAQAFTLGFRQENPALQICAFDKETDGVGAADKTADYEAAGIRGIASSSEACREAEIVFSLVTADQAGQAAAEISGKSLNGTLYLDCNSCAPDTKRQSASMIEAAGGRFVDVAIMTPVHPKLHKAPCLISGPHSRIALGYLENLGMVAQISGNQVGEASVRKMIRSIMIKGLEALTLECFLAARKAGIENDLLNSLENSFQGFDWRHRAPYMLERAITHGTRRAAEMREVVETLHHLGIAPHMSKATVSRQHEVGALGLNASKLGANDLSALADAVLAAQDLDNSRGNQQ